MDWVTPRLLQRSPMNRVIPVFRVGTHTDSAGVERTFTAGDLRAIADKFDPDTGAAPIVKGHPQTDDPAFGWVDRFFFEETTGVLYAVPKDVDPTFANEVKARRFSRVSMAFYPPNSPHNPVPGMYYPRHLGFLGAAAPAVKGLKAANFSDNGEGFLMFDVNDDKQTSKFAEAIANAFTSALVKIGFKPQAQETGAPTGTDPAATDPKASAEYQEVAGDLAKAQAELDSQRKEAAKLKAEQARTKVAAFTEKLADEGRLTPNEAGRMTEVLFALDGAEEIAFTEGEGGDAKEVKAKPVDMLREMLKGLPVRIDYTERGGAGDGLQSIGFNAPDGQPVNTSKTELYQRATAYAEKHNVDYLDAVRIVQNGTH